MVISAAPSLSAPTNQKRPGSLPAFVISRGGLEASDQTGAVGCWIREEVSPSGSQLPGNHHSVRETSSLVLVGSGIRHRASAGEARGSTPKRFHHRCSAVPPKPQHSNALLLAVPLSSRYSCFGRHRVHVVPRMARPGTNVGARGESRPLWSLV